MRAWDKRSRAVAAVNVASAVDSADGALLPAVYGALEADLQMGPGVLGQLALYSSLAATLSLPVWGHLADRRRSVAGRIGMLAGGCVAWAVLTALTGLAAGFWQLCALRSLNAVALAMINPVAGSLVADLHAPERRGRAFGVNEVCKATGAVLGAYLAGRCGAAASWRLAFFGFAGVALAAAALVRFLTADLEAKFGAAAAADDDGGGGGEGRDAAAAQPVSAGRALGVVCSSATFRLIVLHGVFGAVPYHALGFLALWFQAGGVRDAGLAAALASSLRLGSILGNMLGGRLGDAAERRAPLHGRVCVAQAADLLRLPLVYLIFQRGVSGGSGSAAAALLFLVGCVAPWVSVGANRPMLAGLVAPSMRARVFGYQLGLEGVAASVFGAPLVGHLAESVYGYRRPAKGETWRRSDHLALGEAMFACTMYPWLVCACLFSLIHFTYPKEALSAKRRRAAAAGDETV